jgi:protein phosphatase
MPIAGKTDTGKQRKMNEDAFFAEKIDKVYLAVVCDGIGGAKGGNVASSTAVNDFVKAFKVASEKSKDYKVILKYAVASANEAVFLKTVARPELRGMGTTLVAFVFDTETREYYAANVGDSRLYLIDDKSIALKQLTKDHSLVQNLVDDGLITKEESQEHPKKNIITQVVGIHEDFKVDIITGKYESGIFLLCSDGLTDYVQESDVEKYVAQYVDLEHCASELIAKANENGGGDNITAVIIKP